MHEFTIYHDTPDVINIKGKHIRKIGGRVYGGFYSDLGDIPVTTKVGDNFLPVVNTRGRAYGLRKALRYRNNLKKMTNVFVLVGAFVGGFVGSSLLNLFVGDKE